MTDRAYELTEGWFDVDEARRRIAMGAHDDIVLCECGVETVLSYDEDIIGHCECGHSARYAIALRGKCSGCDKSLSAIRTGLR